MRSRTRGRGRRRLEHPRKFTGLLRPWRGRRNRRGGLHCSGLRCYAGRLEHPCELASPGRRRRSYRGGWRRRRPRSRPVRSNDSVPEVAACRGSGRNRRGGLRCCAGRLEHPCELAGTGRRRRRGYRGGWRRRRSWSRPVRCNDNVPEVTACRGSGRNRRGGLRCARRLEHPRELTSSGRGRRRGGGNPGRWRRRRRRRQRASRTLGRLRRRPRRFQAPE